MSEIAKQLMNWKGKVVGYLDDSLVYWDKKPQLVMLIDFNEHFIFIEASDKARYVIPRERVVFLSTPHPDDVNKFWEYRKKFEENPDWEGDDRPDFVFKRGKKNEIRKGT